MFDFFKSDEAEFNVELDRTDGLHYPGDIVHPTVHLKGKKELHVQEARVVFAFEEKYKYTKKEYDDDEKRYEEREYWGTDRREIDRRVVMQAGVVPASADQAWTFDWTIPTDAPPSFDGDAVKVKWSVTATLDRGMAKDVSTSFDVPVGIRPAAQAVGATLFDTPSEVGNSQVSVVLPKT